MDRSRRGGVSRADAAKAKVSALVALKETGKRRAETFEVEKEEKIYDEARHSLICFQLSRHLRIRVKSVPAETRASNAFLYFNIFFCRGIVGRQAVLFAGC